MLRLFKSVQGKLMFFLLSLFVISCSSTTEQKNPVSQANLSVEAFQVLSKPFSEEISTTASLLPYEQVTLMAPMSGQVMGIYFKEGSNVKKGERIIHIYDRNWQAQVVGLKAQLESSQKDLARKKALLDIGGSTQEEIDLVVATTETLKSQVQQLQLNIELANVRAPFSGVLGMRDFSEGAFLKEGQAITTITDLSQLKVDFSLPQEYLSSVKLNANVKLLIQKDTINAKIYAIDPVVNSESRTIHVRALLKQNSNKKIMPGAFAEVLVATNFVGDALLVPTQAVVPEINDQTVYVYKNGKAVRKTVILGSRTADMVRIIKGISSGDTVITTGLLQVKEGMGVDLQSVK